MRGKLIVVEGTDCSGKETQTNLLIEELKNEGIPICKFSFPAYDTPTGKIVGGPFLGKKYICEGWFSETAPMVDPKVSCLYYGADRKYNIHRILDEINKGTNVVLDRYVYSNMAHQGGKIFDKDKRYEMYSWIEKLEFDLLELPEPDIRVFLHMPFDAATILKQGRVEEADQNEANPEHLKNAEKAFIEVAMAYDFKTIECCFSDIIISKNDIKSKEEISKEVCEYVKSLLEKEPTSKSYKKEKR